MDFDLTEEQRAFQATARQFARDEMMPHARDWDENETFPVEALRKAAALGFGGIYVKEDVGGSALIAARRRVHLRGTGAGLHLDRRLYLDPQHGGLDDRRLRRRRRAPEIPAEALHDGAFRELLPDRAGRRLRRRQPEDARAPRRRPLRARRHQGLHLRRRRLRHLCRAWRAPAKRARAAFPASWWRRARRGFPSARRKRSSAGNRSRPPW